MSLLFALCPGCGATARFEGTGTEYKLITAPVKHSDGCQEVNK